MKVKESKEILEIYFVGEMDHYQIALWRDECIKAIETSHAPKVIFDFKDVIFIDSTGIGFVLGRYKVLSKEHREIILRNCTSCVHRLFEKSGLFTLMKVEYDE